MFRLRNRISAILNSKEIIGTLIGIDSYLLDDLQGNRQKWVSYTLISGRKGAFSRYWITHRKSGWFLSTVAKKRKLPSHSKIALERSGIAKIDFKGDQGVSTPAAALLAYKIGKNQYYTIERFSDSEIMFFLGQKIQKPKIIRTPKKK